MKKKKKKIKHFKKKKNSLCGRFRRKLEPLFFQPTRQLSWGSKTQKIACRCEWSHMICLISPSRVQYDPIGHVLHFPRWIFFKTKKRFRFFFFFSHNSPLSLIAATCFEPTEIWTNFSRVDNSNKVGRLTLELVWFSCPRMPPYETKEI